MADVDRVRACCRILRRVQQQQLLSSDAGMTVTASVPACGGVAWKAVASDAVSAMVINNLRYNMVIVVVVVECGELELVVETGDSVLCPIYQPKLSNQQQEIEPTMTAATGATETVIKTPSQTQ